MLPMHSYRAILIYTHRPHVFQMILIGPELDFDALKTGSVEATEAAFHLVSGRKDLKIAEVISYGEWWYVLSSQRSQEICC